MSDLSWLTEDICRAMTIKKGSQFKAAKALGVFHTALTSRMNPLNKTKKDCPLTSYGYDRGSRIVWPSPYPVSELEKWIRMRW